MGVTVPASKSRLHPIWNHPVGNDLWGKPQIVSAISRSLSCSSPFEGQGGQPDQGPQRVALLPDYHAFGDAVLGDALVPFLHRHVELEAGQVRSDAPVRAEPEGQVAVVLPVEDDPVTVGEGPGVPGGGV